jgi:mRNA deadenylase 3'-5' endonuclease subunit Ccr4
MKRRQRRQQQQQQQKDTTDTSTSTLSQPQPQSQAQTEEDTTLYLKQKAQWEEKERQYNLINLARKKVIEAEKKAREQAMVRTSPLPLSTRLVCNGLTIAFLCLYEIEQVAC